MDFWVHLFPPLFSVPFIFVHNFFFKLLDSWLTKVSCDAQIGQNIVCALLWGHLSNAVSIKKSLWILSVQRREKELQNVLYTHLEQSRVIWTSNQQHLCCFKNAQSFIINYSLCRKSPLFKNPRVHFQICQSAKLPWIRFLCPLTSTTLEAVHTLCIKMVPQPGTSRFQSAYLFYY